MDANKINVFIEKAVFKTKDRILNWSLMPPAYEVKPLANADDRSLLSNIVEHYQLMREHSYFAPYKGGDLMLLIYPDNKNASVFYPPDNCSISLRMQDHQGKYSVEIANSDYDVNCKSALIRLYNLVDKRSLSVQALIDDFLNS